MPPSPPTDLLELVDDPTMVEAIDRLQAMYAAARKLVAERLQARTEAFHNRPGDHRGGTNPGPKANTVPVSDITRFDQATIIPARREAYEEVLSEIDGLHGFPAGSRDCVVELVPSEGDGLVGQFRPMKPGTGPDPDGQFPTWVTVSETGLRDESLTLTHELGHRLDMDMVPGGGYDYYTNGDTPAVNTFFGSVAQTPTLRGAIENNGPEYGAYLGNRQEVWARAYSQWVATKSSDSRTGGWLRAGIADSKYSRPGWQWPDDEFQRDVAPHVVGILRERGLTP
jgi:hypothetical protein